MSNTATIKGIEKVKLISMLAFMSSVAPLATDMYLPALPNVSKSFEVDDFYAQLSLASFFIAFALGQLIYGPLSDIFGCKKPLYIGIMLFIVSSFGCMITDSIYVFIVLRFFQALGGCAGVVIARAIVNDKFNLQEAAGVFALMMVASSLAPMLAPSIGAILLEFFSWKSIFFILFLLGIGIFLSIIFLLEENTPNTKFSNKTILSNYKMILLDRVFMSYVIGGALAMSAMFAYITGSSFVFINVFDLSRNAYGIIFAINAFGFVICSSINAKIVFKSSPATISKNAFIAMCIFAALLVLVGIIWHYSLFLSSNNIYLIAFELMLFTTISMLGFLLPNLTTLAMARFKQCSGMASAILGTTQFSLAGIISFLVGIFGANTPLLLAIMMFGAILFGSAVFFSLKK